jgi:hypothetical protein
MMQRNEGRWKMNVTPLFHVRERSSRQNYIVLDFTREMQGYSLVCKPYPKIGSGVNREFTADDIHKQAGNSSVPEKALSGSECEFVPFDQFLNYSLIAKMMMQRGITYNDLKEVNLAEEHLDLIRAFMEIKRNR